MEKDDKYEESDSESDEEGSVSLSHIIDAFNHLRDDYGTDIDPKSIKILQLYIRELVTLFKDEEGSDMKPTKWEKLVINEITNCIIFPSPKAQAWLNREVARRADRDMELVSKWRGKTE